MTWRLKLAPFLLAWLLLAGAQLYALMSLLEQERTGLAVGLVGLLQLAKLPFCAARLNDLGRAPDDAILALVPLANVGLFGQLLSGTPAEDRRQRLIAAWSGEMTATAALAVGFRAFAAGAPVMAVVAVVLGLADAFGAAAGVDLFRWSQHPQNGATADQITQGLWFLGVVLGLYTVFQFFKRERASRASWIPSLFFVPALLLAAALQFRDAKGMGPLVVSLPISAWTLAFGSIGGAAIVVGWMAVGDLVRRGEWSLGDGFGAVGSAVARRTWDVAAPHGAYLHAVQIGLQVVIPGLIYALMYAFVDAVAYSEPQARSLSRSADLSRGIWRRIFKVLYVGFVLSNVLAYGLALMFFDAGVVAASFVDPDALPVTMDWAMRAITYLTWGVSSVALLAMYHERAARMP